MLVDPSVATPRAGPLNDSGSPDFGLPLPPRLRPILLPCLYLMLEGLRERWGQPTNAHPTQEPTR